VLYEESQCYIKNHSVIYRTTELYKKLHIYVMRYVGVV